jgi:hypothetical protein
MQKRLGVLLKRGAENISAEPKEDVATSCKYFERRCHARAASAIAEQEKGTVRSDLAHTSGTSARGWESHAAAERSDGRAQ